VPTRSNVEDKLERIERAEMVEELVEAGERRAARLERWRPIKRGLHITAVGGMGVAAPILAFAESGLWGLAGGLVFSAMAAAMIRDLWRNRHARSEDD
jgi:hypothetical protein